MRQSKGRARRLSGRFRPRLDDLEPRSLLSGASPSVADAGTGVQGPVPIHYGPNADSSTVSPFAAGTLEDILRSAGEINGATVTSTARSVEDQARIMFQEAQKPGGVDYLYNLYAAAGDTVVDTYVQLHDEGKSNAEILSGMEATIREVGPSNVSHHVADPDSTAVIDIDPNSIQNKQQFLAAVAEAQRKGLVVKFLKPPQDKAYHLELRQSPPFVDHEIPASGTLRGTLDSSVTLTDGSTRDFGTPMMIHYTRGQDGSFSGTVSYVMTVTDQSANPVGKQTVRGTFATTTVNGDQLAGTLTVTLSGSPATTTFSATINGDTVSGALGTSGSTFNLSG